MSPEQRTRALRLADELDQRMLEDCTHPAADLLRELAAERVPLTQELAVRTCEVINALRFVRTHLYAAQAQAQPGDDPIIMRHVYDAYRRIADLTKEVELHGIV